MEPKRISIIALSLVVLAGVSVAGVLYHGSLRDRELEAQESERQVRAAREYEEAKRVLSRLKSAEQRKAEGVSDATYRRQLQARDEYRAEYGHRP